MISLKIINISAIFLFIFLLNISKTNSQLLFNESTTNDGTNNSISKEINFLSWAEGKDLRKEKGWKHYKRWEWLNQGRLLPDSTFANDSYYLDALDKDLYKNKFLSENKNSPWTPIGPLSFPYSHYQKSGHGVGRVNCVTFHPTDPNTFWVGTPRGGIWKTNNGGLSWIPLGDDLPLMKVSDIAVDPENPDILYIALSDYAYVGLDVTNRVRYNGFGLGVFKSTDGGENWEQTSLALQPGNKELSLIMGLAINPENTNEIIAAGTTGIYVSNDYGETWNQTFDKMVWDIKQDEADPNTIYLTSGYLPNVNMNSYAAVFKSTDFGLNWTKLNTGIPEQDEVSRIEIAISPSEPSTIYAISVAENDGFHSFYKSTNTGESWELKSDIKSHPNILGWFNGDSTDQGGQGIYDLTLLVHPEDPNTIYAGGVNQWGTSDGGKHWNLVSFWDQELGFSLHADHHCAKYNPLSEKYYFCHDGGITYTEEVLIGDNEEIEKNTDTILQVVNYKLPTQWVDISSGLAITEFYRLDVNRKDHSSIIAGAQDNAAFYYNDGFWINCIGGDVMQTMIDYNNPEIIYGALYYGILAKSYIGGRDILPDEIDLCDTITNKSKEKGQWVTPFFMHPTNSNIIYGAFGNLWKSTDGGENWIRRSDFPLIPNQNYSLPTYSMGYCLSKPENIFLYKRLYNEFNQKGQLWKTSDDGKHWQNKSVGLPLDKFYINDIAINSDNSDVIMLVLSGFVDGEKVYYTSDGGDNWINISHNLPNLPVNAAIHQPNTSIYYIGTDNGIYYTMDINSEWIEFDENLPNTLVSDLVIHEKSNKIFASTFGRGIWENSLIQPSSLGEDNINIINIKVFPNPTKDNLLIEFIEPISNFSLQIIDITGKTVYKNDYNNYSSNNLNINLELLSGVYFIKISDKSESKNARAFTKKVIVE